MGASGCVQNDGLPPVSHKTTVSHAEAMTGAMERETNAVFLLAGFILWAVTFSISRLIVPKFSTTYSTMSRANQAEFASRVHSTLHGIIVPVSVVVCLSHCHLLPWENEQHAFRTDHCDSIQRVFALVVSYFALDLVLILRYRYDMWMVYVTHHVVGACPYFVSAFICPNLPLLLGLGILVEVTNPLMNLEWLLETEGRQNTKTYDVILHLNWLFWLCFRVLIPCYAMYGLYRYVIPFHGSAVSCYVASYITGHLIFLFCLGVFIIMISPKIHARHYPPELPSSIDSVLFDDDNEDSESSRAVLLKKAFVTAVEVAAVLAGGHSPRSVRHVERDQDQMSELPEGAD